ncbi:ATPase with role in protein import into the ER [Ceratobasidium sp. 423]|nr:ATPase with role in protein import into the ER [Ceratobasidium sp. 423]
MTFKVANHTGRPVIQVKEQGVLHELTPEEVSAMVLQSMKQTAEAYLGTKVTHAVITVPAYFNDAQRITGLTVMRILNEPTAAAIAYGLDQKSSGTSRVLVYNLGGGTFDVSLLQIQGENFKVLATAGDAPLGSKDFDKCIMDYFAKLYCHKFGVDIMQVPHSMAKMKKEAEQAKQSSQIQSTLMHVKFEQLNIDLFQWTLMLIRRVLKDTKLMTRDVDEIHHILKDMFKGKEPSQGINPDEAIAIGAAISGGMLAGKDSLTGGVFTPFISCNSPVPISHTKLVSTLEDNQLMVLIQIYEGKHDQTKHNTLIGEFEMVGIPLAACGTVQLEVKFKLNANGILFIGAKEKFMGSTKLITISSSQQFGIEEGLEGSNVLPPESWSDDEGGAEDAGDEHSLKYMAVGHCQVKSRSSKPEANEVLVGDSTIVRNGEESEGTTALAMSMEQLAILHMEKSCCIESLVRSLEECLSNRSYTVMLAAKGVNITAIEVTVCEVQFWRMEQAFTVNLAYFDDIIHTLVDLD